MDRSPAFVRRLLPAVLALLATAACQVRTAVTVEVGDDGSGTVEVATVLDADALARLPDVDGNGTSDASDLGALVRTEDLEAAGWKVHEPERRRDGTTRLRITRRFGTPAEADAILAELTGSHGALRDLHVDRRDPFGRTQYGFSGTIDLSGGLEAFGDQGLAAALEGKPLGEDPAAIEARTGQPVADTFTFRLTVKLPGATRTWSPRLGDAPLAVESDGTVYHWPAVGLALFAAACVIALVAVLVQRALRTGDRGRRA